MPSNPNSPFGFVVKMNVGGIAANYGYRQGMIASANLHKIFKGDVLKPSAAGYYDVATVTGGGAAIGGIAENFEWISISEQKFVRKNWWPGNGDASGDVTVNFTSNTNLVYEVQCLLGPIPQAKVGMFANFNVGSGGITIGAGNQSSFTLDDGTLTDTAGSLPFRVYQLPVFGPLAPEFSMSGYDATQPYNRVWVTIANLSPE